MKKNGICRELAVKKNSVSMESVVNRGQHTVEEQQLTSTHHFGPERLRSNILITLIHAEKRTLMENEALVKRLCRLFKCLSIRISRKRRANEGGAPFHIHFCVLKKDASRYNTATKRIRNSFPEYEGRSLHVVFHKAWNTICTYLVKEDSSPFVWGAYNLKFILANIENRYLKRKQKVRQQSQNPLCCQKPCHRPPTSWIYTIYPECPNK